MSFFKNTSAGSMSVSLRTDILYPSCTVKRSVSNQFEQPAERPEVRNDRSDSEKEASLGQAPARRPFLSRIANMRRIQEVVCVEAPGKIILYFEDGGWQTAGVHTQMAFGYQGSGPENFSNFLAASGFAFTETSQFVAPRTYRSDGTVMDGEIVDDDILWTNGTVTRIPEFQMNY